MNINVKAGAMLAKGLIDKGYSRTIALHAAAVTLKLTKEETEAAETALTALIEESLWYVNR